jgi:hypothetical protein
MPFSITDSEKNFQTAMTWIQEHPAQTVVLTGEHVYDLFFGSIPWPSAASKYWVSAEAAHYAFVLLMLFPACVRCIDILRARGLRRFLGSLEALILSPVVGLVASAAIATGEPRYRIPFDSFFMIVAMEFFAAWMFGRSKPAAGLD